MSANMFGQNPTVGESTLEKKGQIEVLKKVLKLLRPYRFFMFLTILCAALNVVGSLYLPVLIGRAIDLIAGKGKVDLDGIVKLLIRIAIVIVITAVVTWIMNLINNKIVYEVIADMRKSAFDVIQILPLRYIDEHPTGSIVSKVIADVDQFSSGLLLGFTQLFTGVVTIVGTLLFMLSVKPLMTLLVVVLTPISLFAARFIATRTYSLFMQQSRLRGKQTGYIDEMVGNQKLVRIFSKEQDVIQMFNQINNDLYQCSKRATFFSSLTNPVTRFVNALVYALICGFGAVYVIAGGMTVGGLVAFLSYASQYTKPFNEISGVITELQNSLACAGRVFDLIEEDTILPDASDAKEWEKSEGRVSFQSVYFSYRQPVTEEMEYTISDLSTEIEPGSQVAIVGPTGCGKTTLINLLMRFYELDKGEIRFDTYGMKSLTRKSIRKNIGMVLQDTWLQSGTIRDNIAMGNPTASMDEVIEAAKAAHADSFIRRLPQQYNTYIGENGGSLSQGQKQLLCIARIFLSAPPMLILDEATSSIDTRTEHQVQDALNQLMKGRTSLVVAHRLSTIQGADKILVMKDGEILEEGNHQDLLQKEGFYHHLYYSQFETLL